MKNFYKIFIVMLAFAFSTNVSAQLEGTYKMAPEAGALGVGPAQGDISWWSNSVGDLDLRACYFDDLYTFNGDGTFQNILQDETWLEVWQGAAEDGCGAPVFPHDGSGNHTYTYDAGAGTVTLNGTGAFLGLSKAYNGGELTTPADAPTAITYIIDIQDDGDVLVIDIEVGGGAWWRFKMVADDYTSPTGGVEGQWKMLAEAGSLGVGPGQGDMSWWAIDEAGVTQRACYYDDIYVFDNSGSFQNILQDETWIEAWQGIAEDGCGAPVNPHDGSNAATWTYNEATGSLTLNGVGAFIGLPKAINGAEITSPADAPESISYLISFEDDGNTMIVDIEAGDNVWWRYKLAYEGPVGISKVETTELSVYPNPATNYINLNAEMSNVKVFNISGSIVMDLNESTSTINISDLPNGMYFIQVTDMNEEVSKAKFLKQ